MNLKLKNNSETVIESTLENKLRQKGLINYSSSAVFLVIKNTKKQINTQISLINHFLLKRNISKVVADIYLHNLSGELINKKSINISGPHVYSFRPIDDSEDNFEGAVYIHFRSDENLFVPFCAVTVTILSQNSICSVHTYGRVLEANELGGKLDLSETIESGWTLRDSNDISSFAVFHNGDFEYDVEINIEVLNKSGEIKSVNWEQFVSKRETIILFPKEKISELVSFLDGSEGHAKVSLVGIKGVFPRMLCGNARILKTSILDATEIQFTHTNFDFSDMSQPPATSKYAYFNQPYLNNASAVIYPFSDNLKVNIDGKEVLMPEKLNFLNIQGMSQLPVTSKEKLPSRLIFSSIGEWGEEFLPSECSSGIYTEDNVKFPLHWHWGMLRSSLNPDADCVISIFQNKFTKNLSSTCQLVFRLFDTKGELYNQNINLSNKVANLIKINDLAPLFSRDIVGDVWYVFSGEKLEHLHIFATVSPHDLSSGFVEHAF